MIFSKKTLNEIQKHKYFMDPNLVGQESKAGISVIRIEHRPFYDSKWMIIAPTFFVTITRFDDEKAESLLDEIMELPEITEDQIMTLDKRNQIFYD